MKDANSSKFYLAQIVKEKSQFCLLTRYGKIGENGKTDIKPMDLKKAQNAYYSVVREK